MSKSKDRGHRETRRPQQELPSVPNLGNLSMPRKNNRAAAKYVAAIGALWDRRRVNRKARKVASARLEAASHNPWKQHLDKAVREHMLRDMDGWFFDHRSKAFVPKMEIHSARGRTGRSHATAHPRRVDRESLPNSAELLEELLSAVAGLGPGVVALRVNGLSSAEASRVRGYLQPGSTLFVVDPRT